MTAIDGVNLPFMPIGGIEELNRRSTPADITQSNQKFDDIFNSELEKIKFSSHAKSRLSSRELEISGEEYIRLESAVEKAESKGANESLIIMNEKAFLVSIPNKTVITVMNSKSMEQNIITDIDSAVFA